MDTHTLISLIPDFIKGQLSPSKALEIEEAIAKDPEFAAEVESQRDMLIAMQAYGPGGIKDQVASLKEAPPRPTPPNMSWRRLMVVAAAIGALVLLAAGIGRMLKANANERLLQSVPADRISAELRQIKSTSQGAGGWNPISDTLLAGMEAYQNNDFERARDLLETYMEVASPKDHATFYLGVCYMQLKQPETAAKWFMQTYHDALLGEQARQFLDAMKVKGPPEAHAD